MRNWNRDKLQFRTCSWNWVLPNGWQFSLADIFLLLCVAIPSHIICPNTNIGKAIRWPCQYFIGCAFETVAPRRTVSSGSSTGSFHQLLSRIKTRPFGESRRPATKAPSRNRLFSSLLGLRADDFSVTHCTREGTRCHALPLAFHSRRAYIVVWRDSGYYQRGGMRLGQWTVDL